MLIPLQAKLIAALVFTVAVFTAGWQVKGAFVAQRDLGILEAKNELINAYHSEENGKAAILEEKLASLRANEKEIIREIPKIIERDVYHNVCLDPDGLQIIERARSGRPDSGKPTGEVPGAE